MYGCNDSCIHWGTELMTKNTLITTSMRVTDLRSRSCLSLLSWWDLACRLRDRITSSLARRTLHTTCNIMGAMLKTTRKINGKTFFRNTEYQFGIGTHFPFTRTVVLAVEMTSFQRRF